MARNLKINVEPITLPILATMAEIERDHLARTILEHAAKQLDKQSVNATYRRAFDIAAGIIRAMKP